ncbi:hypothetical protein E3N88_33744 [Mikania micrantha]|uniref:CUE domain-containing protein n=1 Tax=Mikania micrantha TaxID=192012 RepID=A0A5N6MCV8_9ASTR|nr:hypothetical protein E3N88_33744 [Mikania micrantha]
MGFNSVYKVLQEVFPQVDARALKAVAIEHSKDADVAVEVVLVEIIPHLPEKPPTIVSSSTSKSPVSYFEDLMDAGGDEISQPKSTMNQLVINPYQHEQSTESCVVSSVIDGTLPGATKALDTSSSAQVNSDTIIKPVNLESLATSSYHGANGEIMTECSSRFLETNGDNITTKSCETNLDAAQEPNPSSSKFVSEKDAFAAEFVDSDDESYMKPVLTKSDEKCCTEFLQEIIEEANNNKKTLVEAMSSVVDLMREVESKEKAADQAKAEATHDCLDILGKVNEVKQALSRAKEANDMHAGEVNAEKAILAAELKELQLRLFNLSDERTRSLGILDEMREALEIRLAAALDEIAAAKKQKIENERAARGALSHQESLMEKVVEESKKLKLEAEENSKLREFLMDRGHAIDILQGEISVKCQDVLLLKEKFDKGIPLSRSFSSSRTSSILASSGSSFKSVVTPIAFEPETYESLMKSADMGDSFGFLDRSSMSDVAPQSLKFLEETVNSIDDHKVLLEDGWEIFDK